MIVTDLEDVAKLRADAENARAEAAENGRLAEIVSDLLIGIADEADENLLAQELRYAQSKWKSMPLWYCVSEFLKL